MSRRRRWAWIHAEKRRYYTVRVVQDLFGAWVLIKSWGSLSTQQQGCQRVVCESLAIAESKVAEITRRRRSRHYQPVTQRVDEQGEIF